MLENLRRTIIVVFCLGMSLLTVSLNLSGNPLVTNINSFATHIFTPLGLFQVWGMFSQQINSNNAMRMTKVYRDGTSSTTDVRPPRVGFARTAQNRMYEALVFDDSGTYIIPMLKNLCQEDPDPDLMSISLTRATYPLPNLQFPTAVPDPYKASLVYYPYFTQKCRS